MLVSLRYHIEINYDKFIQERELFDISKSTYVIGSNQHAERYTSTLIFSATN